MRSFRLQFTHEELQRKLTQLCDEILETPAEGLSFLGYLDDTEREILAKICICKDRIAAFCQRCQITCECGCPTLHFQDVILGLEHLLENSIKNRLNIWPSGKLSYYKDFEVCVDELSVEIITHRQFANIEDPLLPSENSKKGRLLQAMFEGNDAITFLDKSYVKES